MSKMLNLTYGATLLLAAMLFVSNSVTAGFHILIAVPAFYFFIQSWQKKQLNLSKSTICLFVLCVWAILCTVLVGSPLVYLTKLKYFIFAILSIFAFQALADQYLNEKRMKLLLNIFLIFSTLASLSGIIALYTGFHYLRMKPACHPERACGMYGMYMSYGYGMGAFLIVLLGFFYWRKKLKIKLNSALLYPAVIINLIGFYLSYARGAVAGLVFGLAGFFLRKKPKISLIILTTAIASITLLYFISPDFQTMLARRQGSNDARVSQFKGAWYAFTENPILGLGYRNFENKVVEIKVRHNVQGALYFGGTAHNNFLEFLANLGIIGFFLIIAFHALWFLEMWKRNDLIGTITIGFIINLIIGGQVETTLSDGETLFFIMFIYAWSQVKIKKEIYELS